mgnify:CR=1 FL=1
MKKYKILLFVIVMSCISNVYMWGTTKPLSKNRIDLFSLSEVRITDKYFKYHGPEPRLYAFFGT